MYPWQIWLYVWKSHRCSHGTLVSGPINMANETKAPNAQIVQQFPRLWSCILLPIWFTIVITAGEIGNTMSSMDPAVPTRTPTAGCITATDAKFPMAVRSPKGWDKICIASSVNACLPTVKASHTLDNKYDNDTLMNKISTSPTASSGKISHAAKNAASTAIPIILAINVSSAEIHKKQRQWKISCQVKLNTSNPLINSPAVSFQWHRAVFWIYFKKGSQLLTSRLFSWSFIKYSTFFSL